MAFDDSDITRCHSSNLLRSDEIDDDMKYVGGLVGWLEDSDIIESYSTMTINTPDSRYVGGLTGYNSDNVEISKSFFKGSITADDYVGGITGRNFVDCVISNSYVSGNINGDDNVGGIAGENQSGCNIFFNHQFKSCDVG